MIYLLEVGKERKLWKSGLLDFILDVCHHLCVCVCVCICVCMCTDVCFPFFFFFLFAVSWAAPASYGGSQARGPVGAVAASLHQSHSNAGSEPRLRPTSQLTATPDL